MGVPDVQLSTVAWLGVLAGIHIDISKHTGTGGAGSGFSKFRAAARCLTAAWPADKHAAFLSSHSRLLQ
jgi:hypothetical protein